MPVPGAKEKIKNSVMSWEGVTTEAHRFGGIEFKLGKREIGHVHWTIWSIYLLQKKLKMKL